jgi:hypothetical protein
MKNILHDSYHFLKNGDASRGMSWTPSRTVRSAKLRYGKTRASEGDEIWPDNAMLTSMEMLLEHVLGWVPWLYVQILLFGYFKGGLRTSYLSTT